MTEAPERPVPPAAGSGLGLVGLRERVRLLSGILCVAPSPDGGSTLEAVISLSAPAPTVAAPETPGATAAPRVQRLPRLAAGTLGLAGPGALVGVGLQLTRSVVPAHEGTDAATVLPGTPREQVLAAVGKDSVPARAAATDLAPAAPPGTRCLFPHVSGPLGASRLELARHCSRDDWLTALTRFGVPVETK
ncbi:hypothetical protein [Streptomyces sp. NPDC052496]|uniref:hypothetical protein n=1 Tax=Streptomyces sp. NPDC052496 TaxID=3154951 RepID=UPI00342DE2D6